MLSSGVANFQSASSLSAFIYTNLRRPEVFRSMCMEYVRKASPSGKLISFILISLISANHQGTMPNDQVLGGRAYPMR